MQHTICILKWSKNWLMDALHPQRTPNWWHSWSGDVSTQCESLHLRRRVSYFCKLAMATPLGQTSCYSLYISLLCKWIQFQQETSIVSNFEVCIPKIHFVFVHARMSGCTLNKSLDMISVLFIFDWNTKWVISFLWLKHIWVPKISNIFIPLMLCR